ncbi:MAG: NUDIX domain-containing protein [Candidatus Omnitrophica bacterium]|nr:NUDIX domain-containing protein [Candidatus Omnitrophota bacterium]
MNIGDIEVRIVRGDIIRLNVDAIVNPADGQLKMDGGLGEFLRKEGGVEIEEEAVSKGPVKEGNAVWTKAGRLKARHVIHAVTKMADGRTDQDILRSAVFHALQCAKELNVRSLALPALGCAGEGFPAVGAAKIMTQEIMKCARDSAATVREVIFCVYDETTFDVFDRTVRGYIDHVARKLGFGPYVTVDVIIECKAGIVLIERSNPPYGWALPGGFVDYGESLEEAAAREAKEETNLDLVNLRQFHTYSAPGRDPRFHTIAVVFIAEGQGEPRSGDDAAGLKIVQCADLLQLDYAFDHKEIIEEYLVERDFD